MLRLILVGLSLLSLSALHAQSYFLEHWNTDNSPLGNNSIRAMEIDHEGNIWLGTDWGLFRFNGIDSWEAYTVSNSSIPSNQIRSIAFDQQNELWIGTFNHGLARFDGELWETYTVENSDLPDNFVKFLKFDQNNALWISTTGGIAKKIGDNWTIWNAYNSILWTNNFTTILVDEGSNDKYIGSVNGGLSIFKNDTLHAVEMSYTHGIPDNTLYGMAFHNTGQLWVAAPSGGIMIRFSAMLWQWYNAENSSLPSSSYNDIVIGDNTYMASQNAGLIISDGNNYLVINTYNSNLATSDLASLLLSADGEALWIATLSHGLYRVGLTKLSTNEPHASILHAYPNPFQDELNLAGFESEITVYSAEGKEILTCNLGQKETLSTANWPSGIYFIQAESVTIKVIKQ